MKGTEMWLSLDGKLSSLCRLHPGSSPTAPPDSRPWSSLASRVRSRLIPAALAIPFLIAGCAGPRGADARPEVVVYTSVDQVFAEPILRRFEQSSGIRVRPVYDIEAAKVTGLVARIRAERRRPQADVFWNSEFAHTMALAAEGLLAPHDPAVAADIPARYRDPAGLWNGSCTRARVLLVDARQIPAAAMPSSIDDLLASRWPAQTVAISNPLFGTMATQAAALYATRGPEQALAFFKNLKRRGVRIVDGNAVVRDLVVSGQLAFGLTDTDDAEGALRAGAPVRVVAPDQSGGGTLVIPGTVALVRGAPHPEQGKALVDHLLQRSTEDALIRAGACQATVRATPSPATDPRFASIRAVPVSLQRVQAQLPRAQRELRELFLN